MTVSPIEITLIAEGQEHKVWCDSHEPLGSVVARVIPITDGHGSYVIRHPSGGLVEGFRSVDTHVSGWVNAGFDPKRFFVEVVIDWRARALAAEAKLREVRPDGEARQQEKPDTLTDIVSRARASYDALNQLSPRTNDRELRRAIYAAEVVLWDITQPVD